MAAFVDVELRVVFPIAGVIGLDAMCATRQGGDPAQAVEGFAAQGAARVEGRSGLQHQHPQSCLCQHHGGDATAGPGSHHNHVHRIGWGLG